MIQYIKQLIKLSPLFLGLFFTEWIILVNVLDVDSQKEILTDLYMCIPILGGVVGLAKSRHWGGMKSYVGKSLLFFSVALFAEGLGLLIYSLFYRFSGEELAYPSLGDVAFLLGIISSSLGSWWLLRTISPVKKQILKPFWHILVTILAVLLLFYFVWLGFLNEGINDEKGGIAVLFNVLYPTTQLIYLSLCALALLKVRQTFGGRLFWPVLSLLASMLMLYVADYVFLLQSYNDSWQPAGWSDLLYIIAYMMISTSLVYIDAVRSSVTKARTN